MVKKIKIVLGALLLLGGSFCYAAEYYLSPGITVDFPLPPHEPQVLTNSFFWTLTANCKVMSEDPSDDIFTEVLAGTGKVNNMPVKKGDTLTVTVHPKDTLYLVANSGSRVQLTNLGEHLVVGACTAG